MKILTEKDALQVKEIDKLVKNKWSWKWLQTKVQLETDRGLREFSLDYFFQKVDFPGKARCKMCAKDLSYENRGCVALIDHAKSSAHVKRVSLELSTPSIKSLFELEKHDVPSASSSTTDGGPSLRDAAKLPVPMLDRVSNAEAMVLGVIAENSLPFTIAPVLVDLSRALAADKPALSKLQLSRTAASYKMTHGLGYAYSQRTITDLRTYPFSLNIDEATTSNNKKVLTVLASYFVPSDGQVVVQHLVSKELKTVNAVSIHTILSEYFSANDIPWENLVSIMMDSCAVMRGSKSGFETRVREINCPNLLDIDGDSCHHIHNASKAFAAKFDYWLEGLFDDLHTDFQWSPDMVGYLREISEFLGIPFTIPPRFVNHRWLSAYDVALTTKRLLPAYKVLYFEFLSRDDKRVYRDVLNDVYAACQASEKSQTRISCIHATLSKKGMTEKGKERKKRLVKKLYFQSTDTVLQLSVYLGVFPILKEYVKVFQSDDTLVHKLHDRQVAVFRNFLGCFIRPENFRHLSPDQLKTLDLSPSHMKLAKADMFVGEKAEALVKESPGHPSCLKFLDQSRSAYTACAENMQRKLPLSSETLQALSAVDPVIRGHSVTIRGLKNLRTLLGQFLPADHHFSLEVARYGVDESLPPYSDGDDVAQWWGRVEGTKRYPALCKVVAAALSCFHGPRVESSFNTMGDVIDPKSGNTKIETYSAIQTVKYALRSKATTAIDHFKREDLKYGPVDRQVCRKISTAARRYKAAITVQQQANAQRRRDFQCVKAGSAQSAKALQEASEKAVRLAHAERERKKSRKRALEALTLKAAKKRKLACQ